MAQTESENLVQSIIFVVTYFFVCICILQRSAWLGGPVVTIIIVVVIKRSRVRLLPNELQE